MPKDKHIPDPKVRAVFEMMIAGVPGVELRGDQNPYVSMNGNMYASMSKLDRIGIRLSKADLTAFLETYDTRLHEGYPGFLMKEYAEIPESLYGASETLQAWFKKSHAYAETLKAKPTKK